MGVHMPGSAFVHPYTALREALTRAATHRWRDPQRLQRLCPLGWVIDEKSVVNGVVGLMATAARPTTPCT